MRVCAACGCNPHSPHCVTEGPIGAGARLKGSPEARNFRRLDVIEAFGELKSRLAWFLDGGATPEEIAALVGLGPELEALGLRFERATNPAHPSDVYQCGQCGNHWPQSQGSGCVVCGVTALLVPNTFGLTEEPA